MLTVIQRVSRASCRVDGETVARIGKGIVVFVAVGVGDSQEDVSWITKKIVNVRIFEDESYRMHFSLLEVGGEILVIPEFTLYGDCKKGYQPNFSQAANLRIAEDLFNEMVDSLSSYPIKVSRGVFRAQMKVELVNEGPVTLILSSDRKKTR